jgi:hypothetical protein
VALTAQGNGVECLVNCLVNCLVDCPSEGGKCGAVGMREGGRCQQTALWLLGSEKGGEGNGGRSVAAPWAAALRCAVVLGLNLHAATGRTVGRQGRCQLKEKPWEHPGWLLVRTRELPQLPLMPPRALPGMHAGGARARALTGAVAPACRAGEYFEPGPRCGGGAEPPIPVRPRVLHLAGVRCGLPGFCVFCLYASWELWGLAARCQGLCMDAGWRMHPCKLVACPVAN